MLIMAIFEITMPGIAVRKKKRFIMGVVAGGGEKHRRKSRAPESARHKSMSLTIKHSYEA